MYPSHTTAFCPVYCVNFFHLFFDTCGIQLSYSIQCVVTIILCLICLFYLTCFKRLFFDLSYPVCFLVSVLSVGIRQYIKVYDDCFHPKSSFHPVLFYVFSRTHCLFIIPFNHFHYVYSYLSHCVIFCTCMLLNCHSVCTFHFASI